METDIAFQFLNFVDWEAISASDESVSIRLTIQFQI